MSDEQTLRAVLDARLREHLYSFVRKAFETLHPGKSFIPAGHVEAICWHLQQVAEGRIRRLLITVPPRHLKSICTSVGFAAWMLGRDPALKILVASYGQDLAARHARDFRTVIEAPWCQRLFPKLATASETQHRERVHDHRQGPAQGGVARRRRDGTRCRHPHHRRHDEGR